MTGVSAGPVRGESVTSTGSLAQLVRDGQVVEAGTAPGAGPDRKRYAITEAAVTDLEPWSDESEEPQP